MSAAAGNGLTSVGLGAPSALGGCGEETLDCENAAGPPSASAARAAARVHQVDRCVPSCAITSPQRIEIGRRVPRLLLAQSERRHRRARLYRGRVAYPADEIGWRVG